MIRSRFGVVFRSGQKIGFVTLILPSCSTVQFCNGFIPAGSLFESEIVAAEDGCTACVDGVVAVLPESLLSIFERVAYIAGVVLLLL